MISVEKRLLFYLKQKVISIQLLHLLILLSLITIITIIITGTASENSRTFIFGDEDHTLGNMNTIIAVIKILILILMIKGNSLRHVLMQQKETEFCGYSVPHPYEPLMNIRYSNTIIITLSSSLTLSLLDYKQKKEDQQQSKY